MRFTRAGRQALRGKCAPAWHRPAGTAWNTARAPRQVHGDTALGSCERQRRRSPPSPMVMAGQPQGNVIPRSLGWGLVTSFFLCVCVKAKLASS